MRGKSQNTISYAIDAFGVKKTLSESIITVIDFSVRAARDIASLDESDWTWFGTLCIEQEWGERQRYSAIKAVKEIDIPPEPQNWLNPQKYKRSAALDAANSDAPAIAEEGVSAGVYLTWEGRVRSPWGRCRPCSAYLVLDNQPQLVAHSSQQFQAIRTLGNLE